MRKIVALLLTTTIFAGCSKVKSLADINVDIPYSETVAIPDIASLAGVQPAPGTPVPNGGLTIALPGYSFATNAGTFFTQYGTSSDKVNSATLKSLGFHTLSPASANFNFMDTIRVSISAKNLPTLLVGHKYGIPKNVDTFALDVTNENLKSYFLADSISVMLSAHVTEVPQSNEVIRTTTVFHLFANPLN